ncbi:hypothetical protein SRS16CHR_02316 [Variovorax sp. SRS16]|uniref:hypothetical protein n=1 Tax=Variovorax sp. SRS16 TaxID=282217 RepID=UPI001318BD17|nr:hypothetical protein [Variovorax sp. SRS16]VTU18854.1 hypothetical protein SRS16CHR_02316 [Variovorax sp. SRS16]
MDTLLLIAFNLVFVPFLQEAEALGREHRRVPGVPSVLRLARTRRARWFKPFCVLALLFYGALIAVPARHHFQGMILALDLLLMQVFLWTVVIRKILQTARKQAGNAERFPYGPRPLSSLTVY